MRHTEFGQSKILRLIEILSSKVDNFSNASSQQGCSTVRIESNENLSEELEETDLTRSAGYIRVESI